LSIIEEEINELTSNKQPEGGEIKEHLTTQTYEAILSKLSKDTEN
jgi:hypothetical protein